MEKLFHYTWKHRLFPLRSLATTDGRTVEVLDVGLHNHDAGPDFFNAKVKIDGTLWVGNVELHLKSSHWNLHGHDHDEAYDNTILHVVCEADMDVFNSKGQRLVQMVIPIPQYLLDSYDQLLRDDRYPRCHDIIDKLPALTLHSWLSALQTERLERKTEEIMARVDALCGGWEDAYFQTLARYFGFGVNNDAFEQWAKVLPMRAVDHHRDNLFQIEAIFFGQAGLLEEANAPQSHRDKIDSDLYFHRLRNEYKYLAHKFSLTPMDGRQWKFLRMRPQNFPYIRLSQLANLHYNRTAGLSQLVECTTIEDVEKALATQVSEYWQTHYVFGVESEKNDKKISRSSIENLIINVVAPVMFAFGRYKHSEAIVNRAIDLLEQLKAEDNNIVRLWRECGVDVKTAGDSQALIQLKKEYCDKHECLRCRIGYHYIKSNPGFLKEEPSPPTPKGGVSESDSDGEG